ncbi:hypothetical protein CVT24_008669 [Panaeolus cyanescens]|uniref:Uncharacterized protein n=1 Tax=Panaeolus cyanescens TaxID=181874 RepID=A0A409WCX6_9AGAR|nr:hypothetical protein CVT24_008669 [Panaeolus cyanescens]
MNSSSSKPSSAFNITVVALFLLSITLAVLAAVVAGFAATDYPTGWVVVPIAVFTIIHHGYRLFAFGTWRNHPDPLNSKRSPLIAPHMAATNGVLTALWMAPLGIFSARLWYLTRNNSLMYIGLGSEDVVSVVELVAIVIEVVSLIAIALVCRQGSRRYQDRSGIAVQGAEGGSIPLNNRPTVA